MLSRRDFFNKTAGAIAAAGSLSLTARELSAHPLGLPIGSQVYPHRQRIHDGDFAGLMKDMKAIGIGNVELDSPDYPDCVSLADGKKTRKILDDTGLKCPSIHFTMDELRHRLPHVIEWTHELGAGQVSTATMAGKSENGKTTLEQVKRATDEFNKIADGVAKAGLITTLHDEIFELAKTEDGHLVYQLILDGLLNPKTVKMQFQMSSMRVVGDPIMYFNKYPGRFLSLHLQGVDLKAPPPPAPVAGPGGRAVGGRGPGGPQVAVGHDSLDWAAIFRAAKTGGITNYFVEQSWDLTVQSVAFLKTLEV